MGHVLTGWFEQQERIAAIGRLLHRCLHDSYCYAESKLHTPVYYILLVLQMQVRVNKKAAFVPVK